MANQANLVDNLGLVVKEVLKVILKIKSKKSMEKMLKSIMKVEKQAIMVKEENLDLLVKTAGMLVIKFEEVNITITVKIKEPNWRKNMDQKQ